MAGKTFEEILRDIRNRSFFPVYFLMGEEPYYIDMIADHLEEYVLSEEEKEFNLTILYGKDTEPTDIISQARRFPMMAEHHLVIIREAHHIKDIDELLPYIEKPPASSILVICYKYKSYDRRKKLLREVDKRGVVFEGKKLYDNQVPSWIEGYVRKRGYRITNEALHLLADHLGADLGKIVNEIGKIFINIEAGAEITPALIEENIGISKEFNAFEYRQALIEKDVLKAHRIAKYFADNPKAAPLPMLLGLLYVHFSKTLAYYSVRQKNPRQVSAELSVGDYQAKQIINTAAKYAPRKLVDIIRLMKECDLHSKGVNNNIVTEGELIKELTYNILR